MSHNDKITEGFARLCAATGREVSEVLREFMVHTYDECNTHGIQLNVHVRPMNGENTSYLAVVEVDPKRVPKNMAFMLPELTGWHLEEDERYDLPSLIGRTQLVKRGRWQGVYQQDDDAFFIQERALMATTGELIRHRLEQTFQRLIARFGEHAVGSDAV